MKQVIGPIRSTIAVFVGLLPAAAFALTLELPVNAVETSTDTRTDQLLLPTGPRTAPGGPALVAEGAISRRAWSVPDTGATPFQLLDPLLDQVEAAGYMLLYACRDRDCGGFDFRLALDLLPAPAMHVDLGDFRYAALQKDTASGIEVLAFVASRSASAGHLHLTRVTPVDADAAFSTTQSATLVDPVAQTGVTAGAFLSGGREILSDLVFRPGSSELGDGPFDSLTTLAGWLADNAEATVVLVGHTDNVGALEDNMKLSERRAEAVKAALTSNYGIAAARLSARGVGYLAPIAGNDTDEGRKLNRRVEVVVGAP